MSYLQVENLCKNFDKTQVLKNVSFSVEKGEVVSIIGSSGGGKTTLLRAINFLENANQGKITLDDEVLFDGDNLKDASEEDLRKKRLNFGLVFQSFNLFPQYNVKNNVTLAPKLLLKNEVKQLKLQLKQQKKKENLLNKQIKQKITQFKKFQLQQISNNCDLLLEKVGLKDKALNYPCQLSGGQQQRVAIARALALKPKILCFDEPTSALDPQLTNEVLNVILSLKKQNITMIIVTHEMSFAKKISDKVLFMADGSICEMGSSNQIFENPKTNKLKDFLANVEYK